MSTLATTNLKNPNSLVNSFVLNNDGSVTVSGLVTFASGYSANLTASFPSGFTAGGVCTFTGSILSSGAVTFSSGFTANRSSTFASGFTSSGNTVFASGFTSSGISVFSSGLTSSGAVALNGQSELRLADSDSSNYVGFKSPDTVPTNVIWTLPSGDGSSNQLLITNGAGVLSWATPSTTAVNLSGGVSGSIPYQSNTGTTTFLNPGTSGQVLTTQGSNAAPVWATPAGGKILQVVQTVYSGFSSTTNTSSFALVTGFSVDITPASTGNRVLVMVSTIAYEGGGNNPGWITLYRNNTTNLALSGANLSASFAYHYINLGYTLNHAFSYIDSPATTSSTNYAVYIKASNASSAFNVNRNSYDNTRITSAIIAMEIAP